MSCQKVREGLWGYCHGQVPEHEMSSIRSHLEGCFQCARELDRLRQVDRALDAFTPIEPSPYFDQKLNVQLDEIERNPPVWGWAVVWLKDPYLWTFVTLFVVAAGLWLGFRHRQGEQLRTMEDVVRLQDENLQPQRTPEVRNSSVPPSHREAEVAAVPEGSRAENAEEVIPDEDLAVMDNFELLQNYDFLKDLAGSSNGDVRTN